MIFIADNEFLFCFFCLVCLSGNRWWITEQKAFLIHPTVLYTSQDGSGVWVMDQWSTKPSISKRKMFFLGKNADGSYVDPSNNGDALSVIMHD
ncbi:MAG: BPSL0067 family protein [Gammaproteobacteria bacterium]|nr:BPSL0067 family protein [Gammaproteobacteria bacterium]MDH5802819.1 BPSL0067 family protein [Gammaproteobacteria bacterium]